MKKLIPAFFFACIAVQSFTATNLAAEDPEPYQSIRVLPLESYSLPNNYLILEQVQQFPTGTFLDLGSEDGGAARYIAANTPEEVKVYSIDKWKKVASFQKFLSNVKQENIGSRVTAIRMSSKEAASAFNLIADVVYLNSDDPEDLADNITIWFSHLSQNGVICGNNWNIPTIELAVVQTAVNLGISVNANGSFWTLKRS